MAVKILISARIRARVASLVLVLLSIACGSVASAPKPPTVDLSSVTLRFAEQVKGTSTLLQASGQLTDLPYKIQWSEFTAAAPQLQALSAGAADVALSGDAPAINAIGAGARIKIVAATQPASPTSWDGLSILVKKTSSIRTLSDLKGHSISPTTQGSIGHQLVLAALAKANLAPTQVKMVTLTPADARAAFNSGAIDAWATWDPYVAIAQLQDEARILVTSEGLSPRLGFIDITEEALKDPARHAAIQDLMNRLGKAYGWQAGHVKEWAQTFSANYNTPLPVAELMVGRSAVKFVGVDESVVKALQGIADLYTKNGVIAKAVDVRGAFDHSFAPPPATRPAG